MKGLVYVTKRDSDFDAATDAAAWCMKGLV